MAGPIYGSSIYNKVLYGFLSGSIVIPGLGVMIYGLLKGGYNLFLFIISALLCYFTLVIYSRFLCFKVILLEDHMEIHDYGKKTLIRYKDIMDLKVGHTTAYIIDRINVDGAEYIRGTNQDPYGAAGQKIYIDCRKLPVLQRVYIGDYDRLIQEIISRCGMEGCMETASSAQKKKTCKSAFISVSLFKDMDETETGLWDSLNVLLPYFMLSIIFFMSLVQYGIWRRGIMPLWLNPYVRLVFPLFTVITVYFIVIKHMSHIKGLLDREYVAFSVPMKYITAYLLLNTVFSGSIITLFFIMLNKSSI